MGRKQSAERGAEENGKMSHSTESSGFLRVKLMVFVFWVAGREPKTTYKKVYRDQSSPRGAVSVVQVDATYRLKVERNADVSRWKQALKQGNRHENGGMNTWK